MRNTRLLDRRWLSLVDVLRLEAAEEEPNKRTGRQQSESTRMASENREKTNRKIDNRMKDKTRKNENGSEAVVKLHP